MGKKKFIDKRNSATFQLFARDSSSCDPIAAPPAADADDRVFIRVDNNEHYSAPTSFAEEGDDGYVAGGVEECDPFSVFADAQEETDEDEVPNFVPRARPAGAALPDHVRKEILELGFPDDGYNYLAHLREIRKTGGGANYYENSKAKLDSVSYDVKAYDASRLRLKPDSGDAGAYSMYDVAAKTVTVKIDRAVDPDVVRLLDDSDLSRFGSDVEDLEEDFVIKANCLEETEEDECFASKSTETMVIRQLDSGNGDNTRISIREAKSEVEEVDKPRSRRPLDEQFDLLMLHEYGDDSESDDDHDIEVKGEEPIIPKEFPQEEPDQEEKYEVSAPDLLLKCAEYARMYSREDQNKEEEIIFEESSDESEHWDCETIVSTYSNLDNHPGRIQAPGKPNKKRHVHDLVSAEKTKIITLRGKEMLPVDFLPHSKRTHLEKEKKSSATVTDELKRKPDESKEEKKERKAAVKEARREARHAKKQLKELYKCESQMAQRVAAISGPSSIRLM